MLFFDHFDGFVTMKTRSLGRSRGVANMAPAGGIMCSIIVPAILCDLTDARFIRASVWCTIAMFFSLFGIMHGHNMVFPDGLMMHAITGGDVYTTDLGEVMLSTEVCATKNYYNEGEIEMGKDMEHPYLLGHDWAGTDCQYRINGPESGYTTGDTEVPVVSRPFNEGWRFAVGYCMLLIFCLLHAAVQKFTGKMCDDVVMDNGVGAGASGAWAEDGPTVSKDKDSSAA